MVCSYDINIYLEILYYSVKFLQYFRTLNNKNWRTARSLGHVADDHYTIYIPKFRMQQLCELQINLYDFINKVVTPNFRLYSEIYKEVENNMNVIFAWIHRDIYIIAS